MFQMSYQIDLVSALNCCEGIEIWLLQQRNRFRHANLSSPDHDWSRLSSVEEFINGFILLLEQEMERFLKL